MITGTLKNNLQNSFCAYSTCRHLVVWSCLAHYSATLLTTSEWFDADGKLLATINNAPPISLWHMGTKEISFYWCANLGFVFFKFCLLCTNLQS